MALDFNKLRERCHKTIQLYDERDAIYTDIDRMFRMEWAECPTAPYIKATLSPEAYNAVVGIVRLLTSSDPRASVPYDSEDPEEMEKADRLELALEALWHRMNQRRRTRLDRDVVLCAALYGEVVLQVVDVRTSVQLMERSGRSDKRLKRLAEYCPYTFQVYNPRNVYPTFDMLGVSSVLIRQRRHANEVRSFWGKLAKDLPDDDSYVTYYEYWDDEYRVVWCDDTEPFLNERHELPRIPFVCEIVSGTDIYSEPHRQRMPLLLPLRNGRWWQRINLVLTQLYTNVGLLAQPTWVAVTVDGRQVEVDLSKPGGIVSMRPGESITPLARQLIDTATKLALDIADARITSSTIPKVVFGESPGATLSYSAINLLTQGGRLPIIPIQRGCETVLSKAFEILLEMVKDSGKTVEIYGKGKVAKLSPSDINPQHMEVNIKMTLDIPQDRLQMAHVIAALRSSRGVDGLPLISANTAREMLGWMQPVDEERRVLEELFMGKHIQEYMAQQPAQPAQPALSAQPAQPAPTPELAPPTWLGGVVQMPGEQPNNPGLQFVPSAPQSEEALPPGEMLPPEETMGGLG